MNIKKNLIIFTIMVLHVSPNHTYAHSGTLMSLYQYKKTHVFVVCLLNKSKFSFLVLLHYVTLLTFILQSLFVKVEVLSRNVMRRFTDPDVAAWWLPSDTTTRAEIPPSVLHYWLTCDQFPTRPMTYYNVEGCTDLPPDSPLTRSHVSVLVPRSAV